MPSKNLHLHLFENLKDMYAQEVDVLQSQIFI
jgi:hypothetical protein